jgi:hypothetical protein
VLHWSDVTLSSCAGARQAFVLFSRVPQSSFEAAARQPHRSGWYSVMVLTLALPHSAVQWRGWPHKEGWRKALRYDSKAVSEGQRGEVSSLTQALAACHSI